MEISLVCPGCNASIVVQLGLDTEQAPAPDEMQMALPTAEGGRGMTKTEVHQWLREGTLEELNAEADVLADVTLGLQATTTESRRRLNLVSREIERRILEGVPRGFGLRTPVYKLASALLEFDSALESGHRVEEAETALLALLDDMKVFAQGRAWTLREWLAEGKAKWD